MKKYIKSGQNLIEFVFVFPLLVILIMAVIELSMFYRTVHAVQSVAVQAASNAATQIITEDMTSTDINNAKFNKAAKTALDVIKARKGALGSEDFDDFDVKTYDADFGSPPYTLYEFTSKRMVNASRGTFPNIKTETVPLVTLRVDCSDPYGKGVEVQLIYNYLTIIFAMQVPLPNGEPLTIIPGQIEVSSTKIQQYNHI